VYGFVRIETGDELSKRAKFALITWVGSSINAVKRAQVSTDKAFVKEVIKVGLLDFSDQPLNVPKNYAKEILADQLEEIQYEHVKTEVIKCGGANYGTGVRK
jgi:hypothetical protein